VKYYHGSAVISPTECNKLTNCSLSTSLEILFGVLQGSNLGPLLFLCYINDSFTATELVSFLFADDTSCLAEHQDLKELVPFVNAELRKLAKWF
jgi:hypothetical protein